MDTEDKVFLGLMATVVIMILSVIFISNWRWRANKRDLIKKGYTQKQVVSGYKTIWVLDPNTSE